VALRDTQSGRTTCRCWIGAPPGKAKAHPWIENILASAKMFALLIYDHEAYALGHQGAAEHPCLGPLDRRSYLFSLAPSIGQVQSAFSEDEGRRVRPRWPDAALLGLQPDLARQDAAHGAVQGAEDAGRSVPQRRWVAGRTDPLWIVQELLRTVTVPTVHSG